MKPLLRPPILKGLAIWNAARTAWMSYLVLLGLRSLVFSQNNGPYVGIGIDRSLILRVSAMPTELIGIIAGFQFGRVGHISTEGIAALVYSLAALGTWRMTKGLGIFATVLMGTESLLLAFCLRYAFTTTLLPEFREFAVSSGLAFLAVYALTTVYLLRDNFRRISGARPTSSD
jgi:hypothetical protein